MKAEVYLYLFRRLVCSSDPQSVTFEVLTTSRRNTCCFYLEVWLLSVPILSLETDQWESISVGLSSQSVRSV